MCSPSGLGLRHFRQSHLEVLPVKRAIGTPPPGRLALVLLIPQPRHDEGLALEVAAGGVEEVRAEVDHAAGLGQEADAGGKEPHAVGMGLLDMLCPGPACPAEDRAAVRLVLLGIVVHEDHVGVAERARAGSSGRRHWQTGPLPGEQPKRTPPEACDRSGLASIPQFSQFATRRSLPPPGRQPKFESVRFWRQTMCQISRRKPANCPARSEGPLPRPCSPG